MMTQQLCQQNLMLYAVNHVESLLLANDNEQFSRRNNLRLCRLKSVNGENCQLTAAKFILSNLHVTVNEADIETAHMTAGSLQCTAAQQRRPIILMDYGLVNSI